MSEILPKIIRYGYNLFKSLQYNCVKSFTLIPGKRIVNILFEFWNTLLNFILRYTNKDFSMRSMRVHSLI